MPRKISKLMAETDTKFVGIKGPSGAGKSTAARIIQGQFPNSIILSGSNYHYKSTLEDEKLSKEVFGRTFNSIEEVLNHYLENEDADLLRKWNVSSRPYISEMYLQDMDGLLNQNLIPNPIIGEWVLLNTLTDVWGLATNRFSIDAPFEQISANTYAREGDDKSELRYGALEEWYDVGERPTRIMNDSSISEFERKVKDYTQTIGEPNKIF